MARQARVYVPYGFPGGGAIHMFLSHHHDLRSFDSSDLRSFDSSDLSILIFKAMHRPVLLSIVCLGSRYSLVARTLISSAPGKTRYRKHSILETI